MNVIKQARKLRPIIVQAMQGVDDKTSSEAPMLFDNMKYTGELIKVGTKINWNGVVKKAATDLWNTAENNPDNAPDLWVDLKYKDGIRIIPEVITVTEKFSKGELGWWNNYVYESLTDENVYTPEQYGKNWRKK